MLLNITEAEIEVGLSEVEPERRAAWEGLSPELKAKYLEETRRFGGGPPELTKLLGDNASRAAWDAVPLLVRLEWTRWINSRALQGFQRRQRAGKALRRAPSGDRG